MKVSKDQPLSDNNSDYDVNEDAKILEQHEEWLRSLPKASLPSTNAHCQDLSRVSYRKKIKNQVIDNAMDAIDNGKLLRYLK